MNEPAVYPQLVAEIAKRNIKRKTVAQAIGINYKTFYNKLRGDVPFTWDEVSEIREIFFPDMTSDELFRKSTQQKTGRSAVPDDRQ